MDTPKPYKNVWLTYKAYVTSGVYGEVRTLTTVRRRAFFTKSDGYYNQRNEWIETPEGFYHVPRYWQEYTWSDGTTSLAPQTFQSYGRVLHENVIKWEYDPWKPGDNY